MPVKQHLNLKTGAKRRPPKPANNHSDELARRETGAATLMQRVLLGPASLAPRDVLQLQRTIGNKAVGKFLTQTAQSQPPLRATNQTGLPDNLKAGVENLSGLSMDDVRVHYNSPKPAQYQALSYTRGTDIHVGPGQERNLPHEA